MVFLAGGRGGTANYGNMRFNATAPPSRAIRAHRSGVLIRCAVAGRVTLVIPNYRCKPAEAYARPDDLQQA